MYPGCAAAATKHIIAAPQWLLSWCSRYNLEPHNVAVLELTLFDAAGRVSNAMHFPLLGGGEFSVEKY